MKNIYNKAFFFVLITCKILTEDISLDRNREPKIQKQKTIGKSP